MPKTYKLFRHKGELYGYVLFGSRYGLTIEVRENPSVLHSRCIRSKLPIMYKSQLTEEEWLSKAKKLADKMQREA